MSWKRHEQISEVPSETFCIKMLFSVLINYYAHQESLSCTMKMSTPHTLTAFDRLTVPQFSRNSYPIKNFHYCLLHQYLKVENVWVRQFPGGQQTRVHRPPASFPKCSTQTAATSSRHTPAAGSKRCNRHLGNAKPQVFSIQSFKTKFVNP